MIIWTAAHAREQASEYKSVGRLAAVVALLPYRFRRDCMYVYIQTSRGDADAKHFVIETGRCEVRRKMYRFDEDGRGVVLLLGGRAWVVRFLFFFRRRDDDELWDCLWK